MGEDILHYAAHVLQIPKGNHRHLPKAVGEVVHIYQKLDFKDSLLAGENVAFDEDHGDNYCKQLPNEYRDPCFPGEYGGGGAQPLLQHPRQ